MSDLPDRMIAFFATEREALVRLEKLKQSLDGKKLRAYVTETELTQIEKLLGSLD
jgi:hypothetical protein